MKLVSLLVGSAIAAATLFSGSLAFADEPPTCADALTLFQDAAKAADAALAADKAADVAKAADDASADAAAAVDAARAAALAGGVTTAELTDKGAALRTEKAALLEIPEAQRTDAQNDRLIVISAKLKLIDAFVAAGAKAAAAKVAADATDADALRREAGKTDADDLAKKAGAARTVADDACKGTPGVTVTPLPAPPVVYVPVPRGIDTGRA